MFELQIDQVRDIIRRTRLCAEKGYEAVPESEWVSGVELMAWYSATKGLIISSFGVESSELNRYSEVLTNRDKLSSEALARNDPNWSYTYWIFHYQELIGLLMELEARYESLHPQRKEIVMGNKVVIGNVTGSIVNIDSTLEHVTQEIGGSKHIDESVRATLTDLVEQLKKELEKAPAASSADAEAVADSAKALVEAGTKAQPNRRSVEITANGLKEAAEGLSGAMPAILGISSSIIKTVFQVFGGSIF